MDELIPNDWRVEIVVNGRDGSIIYHEGPWAASFYWEFGGGGVIAIIHGGRPLGWNESYPWAIDRRDDILERVVKEVIRQKAPACVADMDEKSGEIYLRKQKQTD
jgi:hypothetical protein